MKDVLERIAAVVGSAGLVTDETGMAPHMKDWRGRYSGRPLAVVRPASTRAVAEVVKICAETRTAIVPQGGNTGLQGGGITDASGTQILLSTGRMNRVRAVDALNNTITVEAGCVLEHVQRAAEDAGRLFPLSLGAEGSATLGGNLSTNAGGTGVLRYGNTRDLALGLEVVLASGEVWDGLRGLRKDNTGYDLKHLFIGAEGTLGVITAAVMKLYPLPAARLTAIAAVGSPHDALRLLSIAQRQSGDALTGFEMISDFCITLLVKHFPATRTPFDARHPQYVLMEISDARSEASARTAIESILAEGMEAGIARDAVVAQSLSQVNAMWAMREDITEAQRLEGLNVKHDVSVPISRIAEFMDATEAALRRAYPDVRLVVFGHLGDGNLHYNVCGPQGVAPEVFLREEAGVTRIVHDSVARFNGSISAEHGLGQLRREEIRRYKSALELDLMRKLKAALDPLGIMNPGKVL
ncbi:MAG: hydroxyacid dehydrogenase [Betaproteobacteria bacterium RIFCSPLOWO2_12_FULL_63_13]|nr:MAG: hydroxyacid dehydrogenase [Betaproteobacteria bacterium RIFCSPLOWO2_12_FULL_63_13]